MAITNTHLTTASSSVNGKVFTTLSVTPGGNKLVTLAVISEINSGVVDAPAVAGNGLTWVEIANVAYATIAAQTARLAFFRAMGASPSSGTIVITFPATVAAVIWSVFEFDGVDTSGSNGSGAVVQSATNRVDSASSLIVTLASFGNSNNGACGCFATSTNNTGTEGTGFSLIAQDTETSPSIMLGTEWRNDNDTSVDMSFSSSNRIGGIAFEIKAAAAGRVMSSLVNAGGLAGPGGIAGPGGGLAG